MKIKEGVSLDGISAHIERALPIIDQVYVDITGSEVTVTSTTDGVHSKHSLHYSGNALDLRTRDITDEQAGEIVLELKRLLDKEYDIVLEGDHIHFEYDPH